MVTKKRSLGTGLDSLFGADSVTVEKETTATLPLTKLEPRQEQPRNYFDEEAIEELAESIRTYGIIQPIVVRKMENGYYQIVAGEIEIPSYFDMTEDEYQALKASVTVQ